MCEETDICGSAAGSHTVRIGYGVVLWGILPWCVLVALCDCWPDLGSMVVNGMPCWCVGVLLCAYSANGLYGRWAGKRELRSQRAPALSLLDVLGSMVNEVCHCW